MRVIAVVAVVAIDKYMSRRHTQRSEGVRRGLGYKWLIASFAIDNELAVPDLHRTTLMMACITLTADHRESLTGPGICTCQICARARLIAFGHCQLMRQACIPQHEHSKMHNIHPYELTSTVSPSTATTRLMKTSSAKRCRKTLLCSKYWLAKALSCIQPTGSATPSGGRNITMSPVWGFLRQYPQHHKAASWAF